MIVAVSPTVGSTYGRLSIGPQADIAKAHAATITDLGVGDHDVSALAHVLGGQ